MENKAKNDKQQWNAIKDKVKIDGLIGQVEDSVQEDDKRQMKKLEKQKHQLKQDALIKGVQQDSKSKTPTIKHN